MTIMEHSRLIKRKNMKWKSVIHIRDQMIKSCKSDAGKKDYIFAV